MTFVLEAMSTQERVDWLEERIFLAENDESRVFRETGHAALFLADIGELNEHVPFGLNPTQVEGEFQGRLRWGITLEQARDWLVRARGELAGLGAAHFGTSGPGWPD